VLQARVAFKDAVPAQPFAFVIEPMDIVLRDFSLLGDAPATLVVDAKGDGGAHVTMDAKVLVSAMSADGELNVASLDIPRFASYFAEPLAFSVEQAQARLATRFKLALVDGVPKGDVAVREAGVAQLRLMRKGDKQPFAQVDDIVLSGAAVDLAARTVKVDAFELIKPKVRVARARRMAASIWPGWCETPSLRRPPRHPLPSRPGARRGLPCSVRCASRMDRSGSRTARSYSRVWSNWTVLR
jgi:hypothetical protein